jgi:hypothetical protein
MAALRGLMRQLQNKSRERKPSRLCRCEKRRNQIVWL